jgi:uncharacterized membrane protein (DUF4010 family)
MLIRVFIWTTLFAFPVARELFLPLLLMLLVSLAPAWQVLREHKKETNATPLTPENPLDIKNAIFFVFLYVGITLLMYASRHWLNPAMTYLTGAVAGIADSDAITIATAKWAATPTGQIREAAIIILIAVMSNSLFKGLISVFRGDPALRKHVGLGFGLVLLVGLGWLIFWLI